MSDATEELFDKAQALRELQGHRGWEELCKHMKKRADSKLSEMRGKRSQEELALSALEFMFLNDFPESPKQLEMVYRQQAESRSKSEGVKR